MRAPKSFEEGISRLEQLQEKMANPETPLAETIKLYSEAASLIAYCNTTLEAAKLQVEELDAALNRSQEEPDV